MACSTLYTTSVIDRLYHRRKMTLTENEITY
jgi:hypothetical protein